MNTRKAIITVLLVAAPMFARAEDTGWYGGVSASYLYGNGDATLYGTSDTVYGGSPVISMDDGGRFSLVTGYDIAGPLRLEGEFGFLNMDTDNGVVTGRDDRSEDLFALGADIDSLLLMLNVAYDFRHASASRFQPYVEAGIGAVRHDSVANLLVSYEAPLWAGTALAGTVDGVGFPDGETTEFAWSIAAGFRLELARRLSLSVELGYLDLGETVTGTNADGDAIGFTGLSAEQLTLGFDYRF